MDGIIQNRAQTIVETCKVKTCPRRYFGFKERERITLLVLCEYYKDDDKICDSDYDRDILPILILATIFTNVISVIGMIIAIIAFPLLIALGSIGILLMLAYVVTLQMSIKLESFSIYHVDFSNEGDNIASQNCIIGLWEEKIELSYIHVLRTYRIIKYLSNLVKIEHIGLDEEEKIMEVSRQVLDSINEISTGRIELIGTYCETSNGYVRINSSDDEECNLFMKTIKELLIWLGVN